MAEKQEDQVERSPDFRRFFANSFRLRMSNNDVGLTFAVHTDNPRGEVVFVDEAQVMMTLTAAKLLMHVLQKTVSVHEQKHGPIVLAPDKLEEVDKNILPAAEH